VIPPQATLRALRVGVNGPKANLQGTHLNRNEGILLRPVKKTSPMKTSGLFLVIVAG
jgi:hypothetical protein